MTSLSVLKARAIEAVRGRFSTVEPQYRRYRGWLKSVSGSVWVDGRPGYVYVQRRDTSGAQTEEIRMPDTNVPDINGYPVIVGRTHLYRNEDIVIGRDTETESSWLYDYTMQAHHAQHERGGFDTVWVHGRVIIPLRVNPQTTPDLTIDILAGVYPTLTGNTWYDGATSYSMSANIPANGQRWVVVGIDQSTDSVIVQNGSIVTKTRSLAWSDLPTIPADMVTLAAVAMYAGQTTITEDDIVDMRAFAGWAGTLAVQEDAVEVLSAATALNFTGDGVSVTVSGSVATILITGGGSGTEIDVKDDGVLIVDGVTILSFTGDGVSVAADGTTAVITIDAVAASSLSVKEDGVLVVDGATILSFTGDGVSVAADGTTAVITIDGATASNISVQDDGVLVVDGVTVLNFTGDGIAVTARGTIADVRHYVPDHDHTGDAEDGGLLAFTAISDVDTVTDPPDLNDVLKWDGANWVPATYDYEFEFSIASFADGQTSPQLIGAGVWKAAGAISFTASYTNGPPTAAEIQLSSDGGVAWGSALTLSSPYTSGVSGEGTNYPNDKDKYVTFTLDADKGAENDTDTETVYFRNWVVYCVTSKTSGYTSADITACSNKLVTNDYTQSGLSLNPGAGEYILFAYPDSYAALHATGVLFNSISCPMEAPEVVSVTNSAGFVEDFKVYRSSLANLGNHTLQTSTSSILQNLLYWGVTTKADTYTEADIEGLATSTASNDATRTFTVTAGASEYIAFAYPTRLGTVTFWVGGFEGGFQDPETVSVTNANGYTENYYIYRSDNVNLGETEVTTT